MLFIYGLYTQKRYITTGRSETDTSATVAAGRGISRYELKWLSTIMKYGGKIRRLEMKFESNVPASTMRTGNTPCGFLKN